MRRVPPQLWSLLWVFSLSSLGNSDSIRVSCRIQFFWGIESFQKKLAQLSSSQATKLVLFTFVAGCIHFCCLCRRRFCGPERLSSRGVSKVASFSTGNVTSLPPEVSVFPDRKWVFSSSEVGVLTGSGSFPHRKRSGALYLL